MTFLKTSKYCFFIIIIAMSMISCDRSRVFDKFKDVKDGIWNSTEKVKFDVDIDDSVSYHKVFVNVRNSGDYKFSNLYLFLSTVYPDGKISRDTIDCILANDKGKWLGKGLGDKKDCQFLLKKGVRFHQKGIYSFEIEQGMRVEKLEGIESVGLRIEKME